MTIGLIIIALVGLFAVLSHRRTRFEERVFKNVPLNDWLTILGVPLPMYIGWALVIKNILARPNINLIPVDDFDFLAMTIIFLVYAFTGNTLHFTAKIIWRYLPEPKNSMVYKVNEMFHNKLSHYLVYVNFMIILFLSSVIELNHPLIDGGLEMGMALILGSAAIIFGFSAAKAIFYTNQWFGGYNRPLSLVGMILAGVLVIMLKTFNLSLAYYPMGYFTVVSFSAFLGAFIFRQIFIFTRLNNKRKLRFMAKLLSV